MFFHKKFINTLIPYSSNKEKNIDYVPLLVILNDDKQVEHISFCWHKVQYVMLQL